MLINFLKIGRSVELLSSKSRLVFKKMECGINLFNWDWQPLAIFFGESVALVAVNALEAVIVFLYVNLKIN
ncbi:hypothetical protein L596_013044 [Steinernema carpocapsae]|uniref:Uncharacterized protein n=1 Tax=Steinernema carpocapsae TaxID=34508 RepID=A0A4U5NYY7_STECR|nr:hypothetical protein L596_013044 [Steinernema carpocapsae]